jgi:hypothetical protein
MLFEMSQSNDNAPPISLIITGDNFEKFAKNPMRSKMQLIRERTKVENRVTLSLSFSTTNTWRWRRLF